MTLPSSPDPIDLDRLGTLYELNLIPSEDTVADVRRLLALAHSQAGEIERLREHSAGRAMDIVTLGEMAGRTETAEAEAASLRERVERLAYCLLPAQMALSEHDLCAEPLADDVVIYSFTGSGASARVTIGDIRAALAQEKTK